MSEQSEPSDQELDDLVRRLNPVRDLDDGHAFDDADVAILQRVHDRLRTASPPRSVATVMRRRWLFGSLAPASIAVALIVALGVIVSSQWIMPTTANASSPRPLILTDVDPSVGELVRGATERLRGTRSVPVPTRESSQQGWYAALTIKVDERTAVLTPEDRRVVWSGDLSGRITTWAGSPYRADGDPTLPADSGARTPGTVISDESFAPGAFPIRDARTPGQSKTALVDYLAAMASTESPRGAGDLIEALARVQEAWTLTNDQQALILEILAEQGDMSVAGSGTDRAGRPVVAFKATPVASPSWDYLLLVSTETGRILGLETIQTIDVPGSPLPAGSVSAYTLWETGRR